MVVLRSQIGKLRHSVLNCLPKVSKPRSSIPELVPMEPYTASICSRTLPHALSNGRPQPSLEPDLPTPQSAFESDMSEIILCQNEVDLALKNLQTWMKDESVSTNLVSTVVSVMVGGGGSPQGSLPQAPSSLETKISQSLHWGPITQGGEDPWEWGKLLLIWHLTITLHPSS